jgi:hypothetical protein
MNDIKERDLVWQDLKNKKDEKRAAAESARLDHCAALACGFFCIFGLFGGLILARILLDWRAIATYRAVKLVMLAYEVIIAGISRAIYLVLKNQ